MDLRYKTNQLIVGNGNTAIVTGWLDKKIVSGKLDSDDYAVIGNLYSINIGIEYIIRHLLLNPNIQSIVAIATTKNDDNSKSVTYLKDLMVHGVVDGGDRWLIKPHNKGSISKHIPLEIIEGVRRNVKFFLEQSVDDVVTRVKALTYYNPKPWITPQEYPMDEVKPDVLPGGIHGHVIEANTIAEAWVKILHRICKFGVIRPTGYDGHWQELINLTTIVKNEPDNYYFPEPNYLPINRDQLHAYFEQVLFDSPYQKGVRYTYGQRLRSWFGKDQIEQAVTKLISEIDSASCKMSLWDAGTATEDGKSSISRFGRMPGDSDHDHGGSPCLNSIWVRVVDNKLHLTAVLRSNDMFRAWPSNAFSMRELQKYVVAEVNNRSDYNLSMGDLITISQSAHIYDPCWGFALDLVKTHYKDVTKLQYDDPCGNFLISVDHNTKKITVQNITDRINWSFTHSHVRVIIKKIADDFPSITPYHMGYLGTEIQKAFHALKFNLKYEQDR